MRKINQKEYRKLIRNYYGLKKKKPAAIAQSLVITKCYDHGEQAGGSRYEYDVAHSVKEWDEYDMASLPDDGLTGYELVSSKTGAVASQQSVGYADSFFVESFEEEAAPFSITPKHDTEYKKEPCRCEHTDTGSTTHKVTGPPKKQDEPAPEVTAPAESAASGVNDDDFMADMKSILSGSKMYDPSSKKAVPKNEMAGRKQSPPPAAKEEDIKPLDTKNEHAIFDKIAQSMRYANAYDLGSFNIEQRFDDFDRISELQEKSKAPSKSSNVTKQPQSRQQAVASSEDFITDLDLIAAEQSKKTGEGPGKTSREIPLDPGVGGRSISTAAMQPGDIIISTTDSDVSRRIRQATRSEVSHSAVYIGNDQVIESVDDGVMLFSVETSIAQDSVSVAYRHKDMTTEKAAKIVAFLRKAKDEKRKFDYMGLLRVAPYQVLSSYCDSLPGMLKETCRAGANRFKLGTDNNNEFYCSELVFAAFKDAGLSISDVDPHWSSPQDVVRLHHNGTLQYVGHLKA